MVISTFIASMVGKDKPTEDLHLKITADGVVTRLPLADQPVTFGRNSDNLVPLKDVKASRYHCLLEPSGNGWRLRDLGSSNGTLVNGKRTDEAVLVPGDVIQIGKVRIRLILGPVPAGGGDDDISKAHEALGEGDQPGHGSAGHGSGAKAGAGDRSRPRPALISEEPVGRPATGRDEVEQTIVQVPSAPNHERELEDSARALPGAGFTEKRITLLNSKGATVHEARPDPRRKEPRDPVDLWRLVLLIAFRSRGSDIHLEPKQDSFLARVRVDGAMVDIARLPKDLGVRLGSLVKVLAEIDILQRDAIQEGHFAALFPTPDEDARRINYRVSFAPTVYGQKMVLRILDPAGGPLLVTDLGLPEPMEKAVVQAIRKDQGLLLVSGPTGSGKSTSLTALLRSIDCARRSVVTIEDPVEIQIDGVNQIQVEEEAGKGFAPLLRSLLRQDPDVILVGEIRDPETARTAMQAAMTGHLLLSSIHAKDAVGTVLRLIDLGTEAFQVAQALQVVVAQRLVRRLCTACRTSAAPTADELARLGEAGRGVSRIYHPAGCPACFNTGYLGRCAVFELLTLNEAMRAAIQSRATAEHLRAALPAGFVDLRRSGLALVAKGITSLAEIEETTGGD